MSETTRHDPTVSRPLFGLSDFALLVDQDPNRHYVIVSKLDRHAIALYEGQGYEFESYRKGGVRPRGVAPSQLEKLIAKRETIETMDGYVMSVDKALRAQYVSAGQARMDKIERLMNPKGLPKGEWNPLNGLAVQDQRYFELERYSKREGSGLEHGDDSRDSV